MPEHLSKGLVSDEYAARVSAGLLEDDAAQRRLALTFDRLLSDLSARRLSAKSSSLGWIFARKKKPEPVKGLYVQGDVGRGKTMLMDLFFGVVRDIPKRRAHFHEFMADVHSRVHAHRQALKAGTVKGDDPIPPVADALAAEATLLCFDEFSVTDIADAMILGRLFSALFERGVVLVATSNVLPDNLYKDGLNRNHFTGFIKLLKEKTHQFTLDARTDFRLEKLTRSHVYFTPPGEQATRKMDEIWLDLTGVENPKADTLPVLGREIHIPAATFGVARFSFSDLCEKPLGPRDYLAVAEHFDTVLLENVPVLSYEKRNETKRFITLIDALYDNRVKLVVSAEARAENLYSARHGTEAFEFDRTVSRLIEMQSHDYLAEPKRHIAPENPENGGISVTN